MLEELVDPVQEKDLHLEAHSLAVEAVARILLGNPHIRGEVGDILQHCLVVHHSSLGVEAHARKPVVAEMKEEYPVGQVVPRGIHDAVAQLR